MGENSKIEWCHHTANFWWGCHKVSAGCQHCYADSLSKRWGKRIWGTPKTTQRERKKGIWKEILKWDKQAKADRVRRRVFVSSMSDFLEDHPQVYEWREEAKRIIENLQWLDILMLTKRPENAPRFLADWFAGTFPPHVWVGTSVENQEQADIRIPHLLQVPAKIRFLSMEPLLGAVDLTNIHYDDMVAIDCLNSLVGFPLPHAPIESGAKIHWCIVGGESGHKARPMHPDWTRSLRDQCQEAGVPFFFKQWGKYAPSYLLDSVQMRKVYEPYARGKNRDGLVHALPNGQFAPIGEGSDSGVRMYRVGKKKAGRLLDGREWNEMPASETSQNCL